jgi:hypothetical protein
MVVIFVDCDAIVVSVEERSLACSDNTTLHSVLLSVRGMRADTVRGPGGPLVPVPNRHLGRCEPKGRTMAMLMSTFALVQEPLVAEVCGRNTNVKRFLELAEWQDLVEERSP